jgi:hypothetical protein
MDENNRFSEYIKIQSPQPIKSQFVFQTAFNNIFKDKFELQRKLFEGKNTNFSLEQFRGNKYGQFEEPVTNPQDLFLQKLSNMINDLKNILNESSICPLATYDQFRFFLKSIELKTSGFTNDELNLIKKTCRTDFSDFFQKEFLKVIVIVLADIEKLIINSEEKEAYTDIINKMTEEVNKKIKELKDQEDIINACYKKINECVYQGKVNQFDEVFKKAVAKFEEIKKEIIVILES